MSLRLPQISPQALLATMGSQGKHLGPLKARFFFFFLNSYDLFHSYNHVKNFSSCRSMKNSNLIALFRGML